MNCNSYGNLNLLILSQSGIIKGVSLNSVLIRIHHFNFNLLKLILRVVCQMNKDVYLVRLDKARNYTNLYAV